MSTAAAKTTRFRRSLVRIWKLLVAIVSGFRGEKIALRAGNLTFISLTALVPMAAVILSLIHVFQHGRIDTLVMKFFSDVLSPGGQAQTEAMLKKLLGAASSKTAGGVSFLVLMVSSGLMLRQVDASLNDIWSVRRKRPVPLSILLYAGTLLLGPLLIAVALVGTDGLKQLLQWADFPFAAGTLIVGSAFTAMVVFLLLFKLAPHAPVSWSAACIGGGLAGAAWELGRHVYGGIASFFFSANPLYGSLGIAPLFLMWVYVSWFIVLTGARLSYAVEHADFYNAFSELQAHPRSNELIATRIAELVTAAHLDQKPGPSVRTLASTLALPGQRIRDLVDLMVRAGLLIVDGRRLIHPAGPTDALTVADVSRAVGGSASLSETREATPAGFANTAKLFMEIDNSTIERLKAITWKQLVATSREDEKG